MTDNRKINEKIIQYLLLMHFKFIIGGSRYYYSNFTYFFRFKFVALFITFSFICESLFLYIYL